MRFIPPLLIATLLLALPAFASAELEKKMIARKLAESIKLVGPRLCIADCGPGTITPAP
ncbi:MAG: hypothetical protein SGJ03_04035 [Alphaproteobacteria bacterium]|nr:hypothetical protein [Alphaproteobacteria bacterium]